MGEHLPQFSGENKTYNIFETTTVRLGFCSLEFGETPMNPRNTDLFLAGVPVASLGLGIGTPGVKKVRVYGCFQKIWLPPNHPFVHRVFHYFHHPFWGLKTPIFGNTHIHKTIENYIGIFKHLAKWEKIFHQPRCPWNKGISPYVQPPFKGAQVVWGSGRIWPETCSLELSIAKSALEPIRTNTTYIHMVPILRSWKKPATGYTQVNHCDNVKSVNFTMKMYFLLKTWGFSSP